MNDKEKISRRSFLRGSIQAGGALITCGCFTGTSRRIISRMGQCGNE